MSEDTEVHKDEFKHLVRIANTDLDGNKRVAMALTGVKGVGRRVANVLAQKSGVAMNEKVGTLPDSDIDKLKQVGRVHLPRAFPHGCSTAEWIYSRARVCTCVVVI